MKDHLDAGCVFMQGAAGDMSVSPPEGHRSPQQFGELLADHVLELTAGTETTVPEKPRYQRRESGFVRLSIPNQL
ncbi:MAG: hypothetical protein R3B91_19535 [Planctomycetaceae bacterium]